MGAGRTCSTQPLPVGGDRVCAVVYFYAEVHLTLRLRWPHVFNWSNVAEYSLVKDVEKTESCVRSRWFANGRPGPQSDPQRPHIAPPSCEREHGDPEESHAENQDTRRPGANGGGRGEDPRGFAGRGGGGGGGGIRPPGAVWRVGGCSRGHGGPERGCPGDRNDGNGSHQCRGWPEEKASVASKWNAENGHSAGKTQIRESLERP